MEIFGGLFVLLFLILLSGVKVVKDGSRLVVFRMGRVVATKGAGVHMIMPFVESADIVDTRLMMLETPAVSARTIDGIAVTLSAICTFQISDAKKAVTGVEDAPKATAVAAQTGLSQVVQQIDAASLTTELKGVNKKLKAILTKQTQSWGITIKSVEVKNVQIIDER
jgi:regulator of protease activity HflC (stomatin/prohibitin superfamily)